MGRKGRTTTVSASPAAWTGGGARQAGWQKRLLRGRVGGLCLGDGQEELLGLLLTQHQALICVWERLLGQEEALAPDVDDLAAPGPGLDADDGLPGGELGGDAALDDLHALPPLPHLGLGRVGARDLDVGSGGDIEDLERRLSRIDRGWSLEAADGDGLGVDGDERRRGPCGLGSQQRLLPRLTDTDELRQGLGDLNTRGLDDDSE